MTLKSGAFTSPSGKRRVDFMSPEHGMVEAKNVSGTLSFTKQLRDFADYAANKGVDFTIVIPKGTEISKNLQRAVDQEKVIIKTFDDLETGN